MTDTHPTDTAAHTTAPGDLLQSLRGQLIVSCQAPPGDPLRSPAHMTAMAAAVAQAPVGGIRAQGVDDVHAIHHAVSLPLIGLWKDGDAGVYITPTAAHARAILEAGADIVAIDATARERPDGRDIAETIELVHRFGRLVMADISTLPEGVTATDLGADLISTTLSGYTPHSRHDAGPDIGLVAELAARVSVPVVAEGRLHTPEHATMAMQAGAWSVVVGSAITAPASIATRFAGALP